MKESYVVAALLTRNHVVGDAQILRRSVADVREEDSTGAGSRKGFSGAPGNLRFSATLGLRMGFGPSFRVALFGGATTPKRRTPRQEGGEVALR